MMIGGGGSAPLTPKGREAAKRLGLGLRDTVFSAAYTSPLGRAVETASLILENVPNAPTLREADGLRDVFWGDLEGGIPDDVHILKTRHEEDSLFPMGWWDTPEYRSVYNGETICEYLARFEQTLADIADRHPEGGNILVVSHAALGSFLAKHGADIDQMDTENISRLPEVANTSVSVVDRENGKFTVLRVNDLSPIHEGEKLAGEIPPLRMCLFSDVETIYEAKGLLLGCADSRLSERGKEQARRMREQYENVRFNAVYCSPLGRARELCRRVAGENRAVLHDDLREISLTHWEAERKSVLSAQFPNEYDALSSGGEALLRLISRVDGENGAAAAARLDARLRKIAEQHEFSGGAVAVFTHAMALRAWLALHGHNHSVETGDVMQCGFRKERFTF